MRAVLRCRRLSTRLPHHLLDDLAERIAAAAAETASGLHLIGRLLEQPAHHHRGDGRQHLLQDLLADAGRLRSLAGNGARQILRAEQMPQNAVAFVDALRRECPGRVLEILGVLAARHRRHEAAEPIGIGGIALQPLRKGRQQRLDRRLAPAAAKARTVGPAPRMPLPFWAWASISNKEGIAFSSEILGESLVRFRASIEAAFPLGSRPNRRRQ